MLALAIGSVDYGYPWWLSYGHLPILIAGLAIGFLGYARKWSRGAMLLVGALILWSGAALLIERFVINVNGRPSLPTQSFLTTGAGRVLDMGAGTGRSSIMVLESRPQATLVALDLFGQSFDQHFGRGQTPQDRLLANLKAADVDQRATIATADMRKLPFESAGRCRSSYRRPRPGPCQPMQSARVQGQEISPAARARRLRLRRRPDVCGERNFLGVETFTVIECHSGDEYLMSVDSKRSETIRDVVGPEQSSAQTSQRR